LKLRIRLFASLRERAGADEVLESNLPEPLDVAGLKRELSARHPQWGDLSHVRGVVDAAYVRDDVVLRENQEVALLPPVSGGSGPAPGSPGEEDLRAGVFELSEQPIDAMRCHARVLHPSCGGVVVFSGVARAESRGRSVQRLRYEAYPEMAGAEMARIFARCRAQIGSEHLRMLCVHRTGVVPVGEAAVVVAAACPHREQAFAACRFLIDALKSSLPVWKKELYADGEEWIGQGS
jgi:molybdopterin synthase catalytic subunit